MAIIVTENVKSRRRRETQNEITETLQFDIQASMNTAMYVTSGRDNNGNPVIVPKRGDRAIWDHGLLVMARHFRPITAEGKPLTHLEVVYSNRGQTEEELAEEEGQNLEVSLETEANTEAVSVAPFIDPISGKDTSNAIILGVDGIDVEGTTRLVPGARLVVSRNEQQVDFQRIYDLLAHTNAASWQGQDPQSWFFVDFTSRKITKGAWHFRSRYMFSFDPDKHWVLGYAMPYIQYPTGEPVRVHYRLYDTADFDLLQIPPV